MEIEPKYSDEEWGLLVGLPQSVVAAASQAQPDTGRRTLHEWTDGMTAIADGRDSASTLVRDVANEVVSRLDDFEAGENPPIVKFADRDEGIAEVVERAGVAHRLLGTKAVGADAEAYRLWLVTVAEKVIGAAKTGGFLGIGGETVTEPERKFRDDLAAALEV